MGLLDQFSEILSTPGGQGLLAAGLGALGGRTVAGGISRGGLLGLQTYANAKDSLAQQERQKMLDTRSGLLFDAQMGQFNAQQEAMRKQAEQANQRQNYLGGLGQVTSPLIGAKPNAFDPMKWIGMGGSLDEAKTFSNPNAFKPAPMSVKEGESLIDPVTFKPVFSAPKQATPSDLGRLVSEMGALPPDSPLRATYQQAITKATTHAPGTAVNLAVNTEKSLLNTMSEGLGKQLDSSLAGAQSAQSSINTAQQIRQLVGSGKVITGPGADYRVTMARIGDGLGLGGKDNAEKLANTAQLMQGLAKTELDASQSMRGQGPITDSERALIRRAAAGDLNMSGSELLTLSNAIEKSGRARIKQHQSQVQRLQKMPGAAPLIPFYSVDEPQASQGAPASGKAKFLGFE